MLNGSKSTSLVKTPAGRTLFILVLGLRSQAGLALRYFEIFQCRGTHSGHPGARDTGPLECQVGAADCRGRASPCGGDANRAKSVLP